MSHALTGKREEGRERVHTTYSSFLSLCPFAAAARAGGGGGVSPAADQWSRSHDRLRADAAQCALVYLAMQAGRQSVVNPARDGLKCFVISQERQAEARSWHEKANLPFGYPPPSGDSAKLMGEETRFVSGDLTEAQKVRLEPLLNRSEK